MSGKQKKYHVAVASAILDLFSQETWKKTFWRRKRGESVEIKHLTWQLFDLAKRPWLGLKFQWDLDKTNWFSTLASTWTFLHFPREQLLIDELFSCLQLPFVKWLLSFSVSDTPETALQSLLVCVNKARAKSNLGCSSILEEQQLISEVFFLSATSTSSFYLAVYIVKCWQGSFFIL